MIEEEPSFQSIYLSNEASRRTSSFHQVTEGLGSPPETLQRRDTFLFWPPIISTSPCRIFAFFPADEILGFPGKTETEYNIKHDIGCRKGRRKVAVYWYVIDDNGFNITWYEQIVRELVLGFGTLDSAVTIGGVCVSAISPFPPCGPSFS